MLIVLSEQKKIWKKRRHTRTWMIECTSSGNFSSPIFLKDGDEEENTHSVFLSLDHLLSLILYHSLKCFLAALNFL